MSLRRYTPECGDFYEATEPGEPPSLDTEGEFEMEFNEEDGTKLRVEVVGDIDDDNEDDDTVREVQVEHIRLTPPC